MPAAELVERILEDESLTDGLDEPDAAVLVKWLVARAENAVKTNPVTAEAEVGKLRRFGRSVSRVVIAWRDDGPARAAELARKAGLPWPPTAVRTAAELLKWVLEHHPR